MLSPHNGQMMGPGFSHAARIGLLRVWDALSGEELMRITEGAPVLARWSPDEKCILAVDQDVGVWDAETGLARFILDREDIEGEIHMNVNGWEPWSPNGDRFLIYCKEGTIQIWNAETEETLHTLFGHKGIISQVLWSPSGELIASSGWEDGQVIIWDALIRRALLQDRRRFRRRTC